VQNLKWTTASANSYDRFDGASDGNGASWSRLLIQTRITPTDIKSSATGASAAKSSPPQECAICLEVMGSSQLYHVQTPCGHKFHGTCLAVWMKKEHDSCPMCRGGLGGWAPSAPPLTVEQAMKKL
jgi:hypothetical protein